QKLSLLPEITKSTHPRLSSTLSLHDALPISLTTTALVGGCRYRPTTSWILASACGSVVNLKVVTRWGCRACACQIRCTVLCETPDRKSTRLNSSHLGISYAVFTLNTDIFQKP